MSSLLVKNADVVITMDPQRLKIHAGGLFVRDGIIQQVGRENELPAEADVVIDAHNLAILPGLVNTHHHFFQSLFRVVPGAQNHGLFDWLARLFPIFSEVTEEAIYIASLTAMAEMILSGCTTSSGHLYLYPKRTAIDVQVGAAHEIGMSFHATRGSISVGRSQGGLTPDHLVQTEDEILADCQRIIETWHNPRPFAMVRVGLAPCTPFTVTKGLMRKVARLARSYQNVGLHTHMAETRDEEAYCLREFNRRPVEFMAELWIGLDRMYGRPTQFS